MIATLFPPGVVTVTATDEMPHGALYPEEEICIRRAVPKRRREFTAGRLCARKALAQLGIEEFPLLAGEDRAPRWPTGIVGSISHTDGYCGVAVARVGDVVSVGFDAELAEPLSSELTSLVCTPSELAHASRLSAPGWTGWTKLIFSAKESTYKCYYPLARTMLEFPDVEVVLTPRTCSFTATIVRDAAPSACGIRRFHGRFAHDSAHFYTGVTLSASQIGDAEGTRSAPA
jgi:4'-phosphopantetheinyl transferase EntD